MADTRHTEFSFRTDNLHIIIHHERVLSVLTYFDMAVMRQESS